MPHHIQLHARRFDAAVFLDRMRHYISAVMAKTSDSDSETTPSEEHFTEDGSPSLALRL